MAETTGGSPRRTSRAPRIRQEELRERMLSTAEELLDGRGLGVNAYPLNMEDLIRQVGVPRSSAFHAFGSKENLVFQLALRLLPPESPLALHFAGLLRRATAEAVDAHADAMDSADGRRAVLRESVRVALAGMHATLAGSARWRTFRALSMSLDSFPDDERVVLIDRLQAIQEQYLEVMSEAYAEFFDRFGLRLVADITMGHFVRTASSALEGIATGSAFGQHFPEEEQERAGIDGTPVVWHLSAVAFLALVDGMTEPS
ncbi:TetR/AcrR family transcriptional regulator [Microbacterium sp. NPDC091313]